MVEYRADGRFPALLFAERTKVMVPKVLLRDNFAGHWTSEVVRFAAIIKAVLMRCATRLDGRLSSRRRCLKSSTRVCTWRELARTPALTAQAASGRDAVQAQGTNKALRANGPARRGNRLQGRFIRREAHTNPGSTSQRRRGATRVRSCSERFCWV